MDGKQTSQCQLSQSQPKNCTPDNGVHPPDIQQRRLVERVWQADPPDAADSRIDIRVAPAPWWPRVETTDRLRTFSQWEGGARTPADARHPWNTNNNHNHWHYQPASLGL